MKRLFIFLITLSLFSPIYTPIYTMQVTDEPKKKEPKKTQETEPGSPVLRRHLDMITLRDKKPPILYTENELVVVFESEKTINKIIETERNLNDTSIVNVNIDHLKDVSLDGAYFGKIIKKVEKEYPEPTEHSPLIETECWYLIDLGSKLPTEAISSRCIRKLTQFRPYKPGTGCIIL